jgi:UDP-2,3-diacylglucosamine hydrolase
MHGNRDFLIGEAFCQRWGIELIDQPLVRAFRGGHVVVVHGDQLCTDDVAYQRWRAKSRNPAWQRRVLSRPLWWRVGLARTARIISRLRHRHQQPQDVTPAAVHAMMRRHDAQLMIHGHTHRPAVHGDASQQRVVLSDWSATAGSAVALDDTETVTLLRVGRQEDQVTLSAWLR